MPEYKCLRCGYTNHIKSHFYKHLYRKKICDPKLSNITIEECHRSIFGFELPTKANKNLSNQTEQDDKTICKSDDNFKEHSNVETALLKKQIEELQKQVELLINNSKPTQINGDMTVNNYFYLNAFGKEKVDYITSSVIKQITEKEPMNSVPKLLKEIHFNPEHNENHNIFIPNKKQGYAKVYDGEKWILKRKQDVIEDMTDKAFSIITTEEVDNKQILNIKDGYDDQNKKITNRIKNDTEMMILNNQSLIKNNLLI